MINNVKCPYCGYEFDISDLDRIEDEERFQSECPQCDKVINVTVSVYVQLDASECPCQLENHKYRLQHVYPKCLAKWECESCGATKELTDAQRNRLGIETVKEYLKGLNK